MTKMIKILNKILAQTGIILVFNIVSGLDPYSQKSAVAGGALSAIAQTQVGNPLEGTEWELADWDETLSLTEKPVTLSFSQKGLSGSTGCNRYQTSYQITEDLLTLSPVATTRMACPDPLMNQESVFLKALQGTKLYAITADNKLQIAYKTKKGLGLMTFKSASQANKLKTETTIYIGPETVACTGVAPQQCLQIKEKPNDKWTLLYQSIEGFDYEPGYNYQLRVVKTKIPNPPADSSSIRWSLIDVIKKTPVKEYPQSWLDDSLENWNEAGGSIPNPPKINVDPPGVDRCQENIRQPITPEDRAIVRAGWELFGPVQVYESTSVITAMSGVDGMCRPLGYQGFIFVEGQFAGTLSPEPINSRTDGDIEQIFLTNHSSLWVNFKRYTKTDALCCPSTLNRVNFTIEPQNAKPILTPVTVSAESL